MAASASAASTGSSATRGGARRTTPRCGRGSSRFSFAPAPSRRRCRRCAAPSRRSTRAPGAWARAAGGCRTRSCVPACASRPRSTGPPSRHSFLVSGSLPRRRPGRTARSRAAERPRAGRAARRARCRGSVSNSLRARSSRAARPPAVNMPHGQPDAAGESSGPAAARARAARASDRPRTPSARGSRRRPTPRSSRSSSYPNRARSSCGTYTRPRAASSPRSCQNSTSCSPVHVASDSAMRSASRGDTGTAPARPRDWPTGRSTRAGLDTSRIA